MMMEARQRRSTIGNRNLKGALGIAALSAANRRRAPGPPAVLPGASTAEWPTRGGGEV